MTITRNGVPDEITVSPEYVQRSLSWIDGLDAHEGQASTSNVNDLIAIAREFAKGYAEHAAILKHVITDRERVMDERNMANERAYGRQLHVVFTDFPGPGNECVFVEVETPEGKSFNAGEWRKRSDGLVELVIGAPTPTQPTHTTTEVSEAMVEALRVTASDLLASLDPSRLNPEQFNAWCSLTSVVEAALPPGDGVPGMVLDECASEGCGKQATVRFERGGVGSYYCHACYMRIQAIPAALSTASSSGARK